MPLAGRNSLPPPFRMSLLPSPRVEAKLISPVDVVAKFSPWPHCVTAPFVPTDEFCFHTTLGGFVFAVWIFGLRGLKLAGKKIVSSRVLVRLASLRIWDFSLNFKNMGF